MSRSKLYQKLSKVTSELGRIPKNGWNAFHKYKYVQESDIKEALQSALPKNNLALIANITDTRHEGHMTYIILEVTIADTETGEEITTNWHGVGMDKGDKGIYKAYTGALKYWAMTTFLIATGDDPEADISTDRLAGNSRNSAVTENQAKGDTNTQVSVPELNTGDSKPSQPKPGIRVGELKDECTRLWDLYAKSQGYDEELSMEKKSEFAKTVISGGKPQTEDDWEHMVNSLQKKIKTA